MPYLFSLARGLWVHEAHDRWDVQVARTGQSASDVFTQRGHVTAASHAPVVDESAAMHLCVAPHWCTDARG